MSDAYSPLKALRHLDVIQDVRDGRPARPVHVQVILSDLCNQACRFCSYRDPEYTSSQRFYEIKVAGAGLRRDDDHPERNYNPNRMIPYEKVLEILDDCVDLGVQAVQFTGGGEPTVHPRFYDVLANTARRGLAFSVVTNGVNVARKGYAPSIALGSWARISLDAGTAKTYSAIRGIPESQFDDACQAIRLIRESRDSLGTECVIGVGFVVTPDNWREVYNATKLAKECGADNIRISAQFSANDERLFADFHDLCSSWCKAAVSEFDSPEFRVYDRFSQKLEDLRQKAPDYDLCGYQYFTTYIGGDLNVYRCCVTSYNDRGLLGSIREQRFRDLWMSQSRADDMAEFKASGCERCQFNKINRVLTYALSVDAPLHSEFV